MRSYSGTSILNRRIVEQAATFQEQFSGASPFPHLVIDDFLDHDFARLLTQQFPRFDQGNALGVDGKPGGKATLENVRSLGRAFQQLDDAISSVQFLDVLSRLTGIQDLVYDPWYLGGGTHESRHGTSLDPHIDANYHPVEPWHRRLNLVIYLNPGWDGRWGGAFELFADPNDWSAAERTVTPVFNRCAIFATSEHSWHGFSPIALPEDHMHRTRRSIALFFYTRDRPAQECFERHTVHYVKRSLPGHLTAGYALQLDDVTLIRGLLTQRDAHIRSLYEENAQLRNAQSRGLAGVLLYWAKRAFLRYKGWRPRLGPRFPWKHPRK